MMCAVMCTGLEVRSWQTEASAIWRPKADQLAIADNRNLGVHILIELAPRMLRWTDLRMGFQKMV
jgi:hypothetical protein